MQQPSSLKGNIVSDMCKDIMSVFLAPAAILNFGYLKNTWDKRTLFLISSGPGKVLRRSFLLDSARRKCVILKYLSLRLICCQAHCNQREPE